MADLNAYQGNAELGFGTAGNGAGMLGTFTPKISVDASDKLAYFNFQEQKDLWDRANKLKDADAEKAANLLDFSYGDFLEQDRKKIDDAVSAFTQAYTAEPTAVTLKMGSDGKPTNADAVAKLYGLKRNVADTIKRANKRSSQNASLNGQLGGLKGDEEKLADFQKWHQQELSKPFEEDITLYPDIDVFDMNKYLQEKKVASINYTTYSGLNTDDNIINKKSISNVQSLLAEFNVDYATKPVLQKAVDSKFSTFQGILGTAKDANGKLDMQKLASTDAGRNMIQLANDANSFITAFNKPEVLKNGGVPAVAPINLEDSLSMDEFFTMLAASKLNKVTDTKVDYTGNALGYAKDRTDAANNRRTTSAARPLKPDETAVGDKIYRDLYGIIQQAGDDNHFNSIQVAPILKTAFARQRDETVKRESFPEGEEGDNAFKTAYEKNMETPKEVFAKKLNGKLQLRLSYPSDVIQKDGKSKGKLFYTEFDENSILGTLAKQYGGGATQKQVDAEVAKYRQQNFKNPTPTIDDIVQKFTNPNQATDQQAAAQQQPAAAQRQTDRPPAPAIPAGATLKYNPKTKKYAYTLNGKLYIQK